MTRNTLKNNTFPVVGICVAIVTISLVVSFIIPRRTAPLAPQTTSLKTIHIVTTLPMLADFSRIIGTNSISVKSIVPAGVEPHDYEPTPNDAIQIGQADLVFSVGQGFDAWATNIIQSLPQGQRPRHIIMLEALAQKDDPELSQLQLAATNQDPHFWLDINKAITTADIIKSTLGNIYPEQRVQFDNREQKLISALRSLQDEFDAGLQTCKQKAYVTTHSAFHQMTASYGIMDLPLSGYDPEQEPSSAYLASVVTSARKLGAHVIFTEPLVRPKTVTALASDLKAQVYEIDPLENTSNIDTFNYIRSMETNLRTLKLALECK